MTNNKIQSTITINTNEYYREVFTYGNKVVPVDNCNVGEYPYEVHVKTNQGETYCYKRQTKSLKTARKLAEIAVQDTFKGATVKLNTLK